MFYHYVVLSTHLLFYIVSRIKHVDMSLKCKQKSRDSKSDESKYTFSTCLIFNGVFLGGRNNFFVQFKCK